MQNTIKEIAIKLLVSSLINFNYIKVDFSLCILLYEWYSLFRLILDLIVFGFVTVINVLL